MRLTDLPSEILLNIMNNLTPVDFNNLKSAFPSLSSLHDWDQKALRKFIPTLYPHKNTWQVSGMEFKAGCTGGEKIYLKYNKECGAWEVLSRVRDAHHRRKEPIPVNAEAVLIPLIESKPDTRHLKNFVVCKGFRLQSIIKLPNEQAIHQLLKELNENYLHGNQKQLSVSVSSNLASQNKISQFETLKISP